MWLCLVVWLATELHDCRKPETRVFTKEGVLPLWHSTIICTHTLHCSTLPKICQLNNCAKSLDLLGDLCSLIDTTCRLWPLSHTTNGTGVEHGWKLCWTKQTQPKWLCTIKCPICQTSPTQDWHFGTCTNMWWATQSWAKKSIIDWNVLCRMVPKNASLEYGAVAWETSALQTSCRDHPMKWHGGKPQHGHSTVYIGIGCDTIWKATTVCCGIIKVTKEQMWCCWVAVQHWDRSLPITSSHTITQAHSGFHRIPICRGVHG